MEGKVVKDDEIDLLDLVKALWASRMFIIKISSIFLLLGLLIAFTSKIEYESSSKLLPESQDAGSNGLGGLGGLAGLAGIDIGGEGGGSLSPELYPEIVKSSPFMDTLINTPIYFGKLDSTLTTFNYFENIDKPSLLGLIATYTIGLPGKIKSLFSSSSSDSNVGNEKSKLLYYSKEDWEILKSFKSRISINTDLKTGIITVSSEMPDAYASAQTTDLLVELLTKEVTKYKVGKAKKNLDFIKEQFEISKLNYENKQDYLARFTDKNRNLSNSIVKAEYDRIQNELNIAFEVYKSLASQLEKAKIKVKENTPVFTVLEPVKIPVSKSKPKRIIILFATIFIGTICSSSIVLVKYFFNK